MNNNTLSKENTMKVEKLYKDTVTKINTIGAKADWEHAFRLYFLTPMKKYGFEVDTSTSVPVLEKGTVIYGNGTKKEEFYFPSVHLVKREGNEELARIVFRFNKDKTPVISHWINNALLLNGQEDDSSEDFDKLFDTVTKVINNTKGMMNFIRILVPEYFPTITW